MKYIVNANVNVSELAALRQSVGWNRMEEELCNPKLKDFFNISCYDNKKLIGFVSVVSNGVTDAYIQDLIVNPSYQKQGIGKELMTKAIDEIKQSDIYMVSVIYGDAELRDYYEQFGFYTMFCGQMEINNSK